VARLDGGQTGHDDPLISFYNGVPRPLAEEALRRGGRGESPAVWDTLVTILAVGLLGRR
jgi:hypothetical protein